MLKTKLQNFNDVFCAFESLQINKLNQRIFLIKVIALHKSSMPTRNLIKRCFRDVAMYARVYLTDIARKYVSRAGPICYTLRAIGNAKCMQATQLHMNVKYLFLTRTYENNRNQLKFKL